MKYRLKVRPEAEANLAEGRDWYNKQRPGLGKESDRLYDEERGL